MNPQKEILDYFEQIKLKFEKIHQNDLTKSGKMVSSKENIQKNLYYKNKVN